MKPCVGGLCDMIWDQWIRESLPFLYGNCGSVAAMEQKGLKMIMVYSVLKQL